MKYILGNPDGMSIEQIIELGNNEHFSKLTCSIIPTIEYWRNLDNKIITNFITDEFIICFEYPVKSIRKAKSSYTDVMLISDNTNIAVESKWNEKIGCLCKNQKAINKDEVQSHWINIISTYIGKPLFIEQFVDIEYQLLHRVASACSLGKEHCIVVYQIFYHDKLKKSFIIEMEKLLSLLQSPKIKFYVNLVRLKYTATYTILSDEIIILDKKEKVEKIKNTMKKKKLFEFSEESLYQL